MIWSQTCNSGILVNNVLNFNLSNVKNAVVTENKPNAPRYRFLCMQSTETHLCACVISKFFVGFIPRNTANKHMEVEGREWREDGEKWEGNEEEGSKGKG